MKRLLVIAALACSGIIAYAPNADADAAGGVLVNGTWLSSRGESQSRGMGAEYAIVSERKPYLMTIGGYYAIGEGGEAMDAAARDVYAVRWGFGLKPKIRKSPTMLPFVSVGLDFMHITTRHADRSMNAGMTLGFDARAGVFGVLSEKRKWIYQVSVSYVGAIAPGTGEGLDGAMLQVGVGKLLFD